MTVNWGEFERRAPLHVAAGRRLLCGAGEVGLGYLATMNCELSPRFAPICPILFEEGLYLCVARLSPKRRDLRDPRHYTLHAPLGESDEEFQISGDAAEVTDPSSVQRIQGAIHFSFRTSDPIFELHIDRCHWARWENVGKPNTRAVRQLWGYEQISRGVTLAAFSRGRGAGACSRRARAGRER
jgi:hypothetical protein